MTRRTTMKLEVEEECRKRQKTHHRKGSDVCNDGDSDELSYLLRCLMEGEMREDSSGTEYESHIEDEGVSDSELSLESNFSVDEGSAVPRWKVFRVGGRRVPFSVFDVALMTGLPATRKIVELDREEVTTEVGEMVRGCMAEWEREKIVTRLPGRSGKKRRFFWNYVSAMVALYEGNSKDDQVRLWVRIYAFMILSGVLFPRTLYGAAWSMMQYVEDIEGMGQYNWAEAVWRVIGETIEDTQRKLCSGPLT
ncbi:hypothetical protein Cgig2_023143 [Carnegiea gigantea]|uniref:Aminotransferase-like plant mobile domain-containing protein n=1 Tax=Carnegiea gigantea TaxID=171969 RepID=A0A9Q1GK24_9CARY|nr:hypothetical protein Cgig2_023143 [Carnegiea gigantea]